MMNLRKVIEETKLEYIDSFNIDEDVQLFAVDIYEEGKTNNGIVYISDTLIRSEKSIAVIYTNEAVTDRVHPNITAKVPLIELFKRVNTFFINNARTYKNSVFLMNSLLSDKSIKEIVTLGAKLLDNPVILTSNNYRLLAYESLGMTFHDPIVESALKYGYCDAESVKTFENEGITEAVRSSSRPFVHTKGLSKNIHRALGKIVSKGKTIAYLGVFEVRKEINESDLEIMEILLSVIKNALKKGDNEIDSLSIEESILNELITGDLNDKAILNERINSSLWKNKKFMRILIIDKLNKKNKNFENLDYIYNQFLEKNGNKVTRINDYIVGLLDYDDEKEKDRKLLAIEKELAPLKGGAFLSKEITSLKDIKATYEATKDTMDSLSYVKTNDTIIKIEDYLLYYLFSKVDKDALSNCSNEIYEKLSAYDNENKTNYVETLYEYAKSSYSINEAASRLNLHRNSLSYRLLKIEEIINLKIDESYHDIYNFVLFYHLIKFKN